MSYFREEHKHAMIFINYILLRGGYPEIPCIQISDIDGLNDISKAFAKAVQMESHVKEVSYYKYILIQYKASVVLFFIEAGGTC